MSEVKKYDVIILGGGLVGLTLAVALIRSGFHVALIENNLPRPISSDAKYDLRISAINHASQRIFENLNVWQDVLTLGINAYQEMHVWDASGMGEIHFTCTDVGEANMGYMIENRVLIKALWTQLQNAEHVDLFCPAFVKDVAVSEKSVAVILDDGQTLSGKLLVGADGANSWLRDHLDFQLHAWPYHHSALIATVETEKPHQQTAWQIFLPDGILAFLPLSNPHHCSIVWSTIPNEIEQSHQLPVEEFNQKLASAFAYRLGKVQKISESAVFPLHMRHVKQYVQTRVALIGDAAHTIHPLAGQGVNLGLLDAICLAEVISNSHKKHLDIGSLKTLRHYERWRKGDNWLMITAMESFKRLFGSEFSLIKMIRNLGLTFTNRFSFAKNDIMRRAMGLGGDLPKLAKIRFNE